MKSVFAVARNLLLPSFSVEFSYDEFGDAEFSNLKSKIRDAGGDISYQDDDRLCFRIPLSSIRRRPSFSEISVSVQRLGGGSSRLRICFRTARYIHMAFVGFISFIAISSAIQTLETAALLFIPLAMVSGYVMLWRDWGLNRRAIEAFLRPGSDRSAD